MFRRRTPAPLLHRKGEQITFRWPEGATMREKRVRIGTYVKLSLGTSDPATVKARHALVSVQLDQAVKAAGEPPRQLTQREAVALAGDVYRNFVARLEDMPGGPQVWEVVEERFAPTSDAAQLEERVGDLANTALAERGWNIDEESRRLLLVAMLDAFRDAATLLRRRASGDYGPDKTVERFPVGSDSPIGDVTLTGICEGWRAEAERLGKAESTLDGYGSIIRQFVAFLGHDDARRVSERDVLRYKDHRLHNQQRDAYTVAAGDLPALRTILQWGVDNGRIDRNAAEKVKLRVPQKDKREGYTEKEACLILRACLSYQKGRREHDRTAALKRWVPLLMAHSGARVGEIAQLRREDVWCAEDGMWWMRITSEAGTVKGGKSRVVPLHNQVIACGFSDFVKASRGYYLFLSAKDVGGYRGPWRTAKNRLLEFLAGIVRRDGLSPNHGWRHHFISRCRRHGVDTEKRRFITGHRGQGTDEQRYGEADGLVAEIAKMPAYDLAEGSIV